MKSLNDIVIAPDITVINVRILDKFFDHINIKNIILNMFIVILRLCVYEYSFSLLFIFVVITLIIIFFIISRIIKSASVLIIKIIYL